MHLIEQYKRIINGDPEIKKAFLRYILFTNLQMSQYSQMWCLIFGTSNRISMCLDTFTSRLSCKKILRGTSKKDANNSFSITKNETEKSVRHESI